MNLYLFNDNDSAATYGIGTYINELTKALEGHTVNIHILYLHSVRPEFEIVKANPVEHWYIPEVRNENTFSGSIQKAEDYCYNVFYLLRLYITDTKDLIFHFNFNQYQFLAKELKTVFDCRTVAAVHYTRWSLELLGNLSMLHEIKSKPENQRTPHEQLLLTTDEYESFLYKETDKVITLTRDMKKILCNEYQIDPDKITIIPNGLEYSEKKTDKNVLRIKWHIPEKEPVIFFAGRLHPVKGLKFLIKAFRKVLDQIPDSHLFIAGSGNFNTYIQEAKDICTKVTFTGLLEKKELYEFYRLVDIGVIPSLYEPFGLVALEMMAHELPIVVTSTSGLNEVVDDLCGLKIPVIFNNNNAEIDTDLLAEKIVYLLKNPDNAKQFGENACKRYKEHFSSDVFRKNMLDFYNSLLA